MNDRNLKPVEFISAVRLDDLPVYPPVFGCACATCELQWVFADEKAASEFLSVHIKSEQHQARLRDTSL